jgi:flagellar motor switch protein FliN/FliY
MADMDENNEIEQQVDDGESEKPSENENLSQDGQESEPTPEEKDMMSMADESSDEVSSEETPEASEDMPESPDETPEASAESEENAEEDEQPADSNSDGLLSQDDIDSVLKDAIGNNSDASFDTPSEEIGGQIDPEVKQADFQQLSSSSRGGEQKNIELLMDVELPISIELGKTKMNISDILGLAPGSIVELDKLVGEPVDLLVNQRCVARGEVVVVEENFGLRITQLVSPEERLRNLK